MERRSYVLRLGVLYLRLTSDMRTVTKGFVYQDKHGLYPGVELPTPTVKSLGVKAGTLDEYIRGRVVPRLRAQ